MTAARSELERKTAELFISLEAKAWGHMSRVIGVEAYSKFKNAIDFNFLSPWGVDKIRPAINTLGPKQLIKVYAALAEARLTS